MVTRRALELLLCSVVEKVVLDTVLHNRTVDVCVRQAGLHLEGRTIRKAPEGEGPVRKARGVSCAEGEGHVVWKVRRTCSEGERRILKARNDVSGKRGACLEC